MNGGSIGASLTNADVAIDRHIGKSAVRRRDDFVAADVHSDSDNGFFGAEIDELYGVLFLVYDQELGPCGRC